MARPKKKQTFEVLQECEILPEPEPILTKVKSLRIYVVNPETGQGFLPGQPTEIESVDPWIEAQLGAGILAICQ